MSAFPSRTSGFIITPKLGVRKIGGIPSLGLGLWGILKCMWQGDKLEKYNKECRSMCPPNDIMGQIKFMQAYGSGSISDALLTCTCQKAKQDGLGDFCAKWFATCISSGISGPPRPR